MSQDIFAQVTRGSHPVGSTPIVAQIDLMSPADAAAYGGASPGEAPYFRYNGFTDAAITLLQGDLLTDTVNLDPLTGTHKKFRIIGDPEIFIDGHTEMTLDKVIGS